jgi:hypothetical protein
MKRKGDFVHHKDKRQAKEKNNLEWFVNEGIIIPVIERPGIGYSYVFSNPDKIINEYTFLIGLYKKKEQDFFVGKQLNGEFVIVHWPTLQIFDSPTSASYHFVTFYNNGASKSKYSGYEYLRIQTPIWKGRELKQNSTLSNIQKKVIEAQQVIDSDEESTDEDMDFEIVVKEMEEGDPVELDIETIEFLIDKIDRMLEYNKGN